MAEFSTPFVQIFAFRFESTDLLQVLGFGIGFASRLCLRLGSRHPIRVRVRVRIETDFEIANKSRLRVVLAFSGDDNAVEGFATCLEDFGTAWQSISKYHQSSMNQSSMNQSSVKFNVSFIKRVIEYCLGNEK